MKPPTERAQTGAAIGRCVHEHRLAKHMTQAELAARMPGWSQSRIADLEAGRSCPGLDTLAVVAAGLGVRLSRLLRDF